jgi:multiple sugar transport system permease protein
MKTIPESISAAQQPSTVAAGKERLPAKRRARFSRLQRREAFVAYLFLAPALCLFLLFSAGPLIGAFILSLFQWDLFTAARFSGLANFKTLFTDKVALTAISNTFVFTFWSLVLHIALGMLLALAVNRALPAGLKYFLRTAYFFPLILPWAAAALIWLFLMDPNFGALNYYLGRMGLPTPNWLVTPQLAMPALIFVDLWRTLGFTFVILLTGLVNVPPDLYEAARIDGARALQRFWNVTVPLMSPTLFFAGVMTVIGAFQIFDPMYIMTQGGPGDNTRSIVLYIYETGFRSFNMGYASTLALVVFLVIMAVTLVQLAVSRYWVHYD